MGASADCPDAAPRDGTRDVDQGNVLGIGFVADIAFAAIIAGLPATAITLRADYGLDTFKLGAAFGLLGLGAALSAIPWSMLTERWGKRRVLSIGFAGATTALAAMMLLVVPTAAHVPGFGLLACSLLAVGLLSGCVNGARCRAVMPWLQDGRLQDGRRGYATTILQTAMPVGAGLGALVLPILAMRFGFAGVYCGLALACAGIATLAWRWLHAHPGSAAHAASAVATTLGPTSGLRPRLSDGTLRLTAAIGLLYAPQVAVLSFAAVFLHDVSHLDVATIGIILVAIQTGAAVARVASSYWTDRHGNRRDYPVGCALTSAALFAVLALMVNATDTTATPATASFAIPLVLLAAGICTSAWQGVAYAELATSVGVARVGAARVGAALGLANTCVFAVFFVVPLGIPALLAWASWPAVWMAASFCAVVALLLFDKGMRFDQDVWG
jgi:MFS family permease